MTCIRGNVYVALNWRKALGSLFSHNLIYEVEDSELEEAYPVIKGGRIMLRVSGRFIVNQWRLINNVIHDAEWVLIKPMDQSPSLLKALSNSLRPANVSYVVRPSTYLIAHDYINGDLYLEPTRDEASSTVHVVLRGIKSINLYIPEHGNLDEYLIYNIPMDNVRNVIFSNVELVSRFIAVNAVFCRGGKVNCECSDPVDCALNCPSMDLSIYTPIR
ncbi:MAG: hypothetical protein RXR04_00095 [Caldivirga sp.]